MLRAFCCCTLQRNGYESTLVVCAIAYTLGSSNGRTLDFDSGNAWFESCSQNNINIEVYRLTLIPCRNRSLVARWFKSNHLDFIYRSVVRKWKRATL
jgi:hypothetical protein